jgi:hypothetical protein
LAIHFVANGITIEFLRPELSIVGGRRAIPATFMSMPKTTMHEQRDASAHKNHIRLPRKILSVQTEPIAHAM